MLQINLDTAIRLPVPDVEALIQGRMITAMPKMFIAPGRVFALCPTDVSTNLLPPEQYYRSNFLPIAQSVIAQLNSEQVTIKAWARCELCQMLDKSKPLELFSQLTIWKTEALQQILSERSSIFLVHLRVYLLSEPLEITANTQGQFLALPSSLSAPDASPVMSETAFSQRRHQLENQIPPLHPKLEELQSSISQLNDEKAVLLVEKISEFLGWKSNQGTKPVDPNLDWIFTINEKGTATTGGNYEKGTAFEQIVHRSLNFLGFDVDPNAKGGAGGMDLYCTKPYPLLGECKAGKSIPGYTVYELDKLGDIHLNDEALATAVKLIIGPGQATSQLKKVAEKRKISIINPMTLQKLVELQAKYPGSVNLIELKPYLEAGQIDSRIDEYIKKVEKDIKLRSQIVEAVKQLGQPGSEHLTAEIRVHYNAVFAKEQIFKQEDLQLVHELLLELSSPLVGYLGKKKGNDWQSDRFYYLRDLPVE